MKAIKQGLKILAAWPGTWVLVGFPLALLLLLGLLGGYVLGLLVTLLLLAAAAVSLGFFLTLMVAMPQRESAAPSPVPAAKPGERRSAMETPRAQLRLVTVAASGGSLAVLGAVVFAALRGWTIALVPGLFYAVALLAVTLIYRQAKREAAPLTGAEAQEAALVAPARTPAVREQPVLAPTVSYYVVAAHGRCLQGYDVGSVVTVDLAGGTVRPRLCPAAEAQLYMAVMAPGVPVEEWSCPIYEHRLVFRKEKPEEPAPVDY